MAATARSTIRQDTARLLGAFLWDGTASGGSTTTLVDTGDRGLRDTGLSANLFVGAYVLLTSGADSGAWRQCTNFVPGTGTITVGEPWTTGPSSGVTYEILVLLDPTQWNTVINDALGRLRYEYMGPISLITDGDMEASGVGDWTASNATLTKQTAGDFISGAQALRVANTAAAGYAQSASVDCNPSDSFTAWANYRSVSGTAVLRAWDVTNGASIETDSGDDGGDNREGGGIELSFRVPSTARQIALRLEGTEATADIWWDDVIMLRQGRTRYELPGWVVDRDMVRAIMQRHGSRPFEYQYTKVADPQRIFEEQTAVNIFFVALPSHAVRPIYVAGERAYASLATDAATTNCPLEWAKYAAAVEVMERYGFAIENSSIARMQEDRARITERFMYLTRRFTPRHSRPAFRSSPWVA